MGNFVVPEGVPRSHCYDGSAIPSYCPNAPRPAVDLNQFQRQAFEQVKGAIGAALESLWYGAIWPNLPTAFIIAMALMAIGLSAWLLSKFGLGFKGSGSTEDTSGPKTPIPGKSPFRG